MSAQANAPIIKKVKKVSGEGHHGGAWKVAIFSSFSRSALISRRVRGPPAQGRFQSHSDLCGRRFPFRFPVRATPSGCASNLKPEC